MTHTMQRAAGEPAADGRPTIAVTVNGEPRALPADATVASLLAAHGLDPRLVVVEHNRVILRDRSALPAIALAAGDTVEIVHFVGGG
jgi:thiamine biosynthesis protein ThiS